MMRLVFDDDSLCLSIAANNCCNPFLLNKAMVTSMPRSAWKLLMFLVFKKPFRYAVAGYGVLSCVNGGVNKKTGALKWKYLDRKNKWTNLLNIHLFPACYTCWAILLLFWMQPQLWPAKLPPGHSIICTIFLFRKIVPENGKTETNAFSNQLVNRYLKTGINHVYPVPQHLRPRFNIKKWKHYSSS